MASVVVEKVVVGVANFWVVFAVANFYCWWLASLVGAGVEYWCWLLVLRVGAGCWLWLLVLVTATFLLLFFRRTRRKVQPPHYQVFCLELSMSHCARPCGCVVVPQMQVGSTYTRVFQSDTFSLIFSGTPYQMSRMIGTLVPEIPCLTRAIMLN